MSKPVLAAFLALVSTSIPLSSHEALAGNATTVLDSKEPRQKKESLIWDVNREITGFKIDILEGNPIINTVKFLGDEEFRAGAYFDKGSSWEKQLDRPRAVGQLRVNVDKGLGSLLRVTIYTGGSSPNPSAGATSSDWAIKRPSQKKESLIWDVNKEITGFEVFVTKGKPIVNTVKFLGGEEFVAGAYIEEGHSFRKDLEQPVHVGQLRVNVDKALGTELKLVVRTR